jgi:hypothetical protein
VVEDAIAVAPAANRNLTVMPVVPEYDHNFAAKVRTRDVSV